jgi:hypothetical protein
MKLIRYFLIPGLRARFILYLRSANAPLGDLNIAEVNAFRLLASDCQRNRQKTGD